AFRLAAELSACPVAIPVSEGRQVGADDAADLRLVVRATPGEKQAASTDHRRDAGPSRHPAALDLPHDAGHRAHPERARRAQRRIRPLGLDWPTRSARNDT